METELQGAIYYMVGCAKELLAESERAVSVRVSVPSVPQCHMGADSNIYKKKEKAHQNQPRIRDSTIH
jgi:hypothetical protein